MAGALRKTMAYLGLSEAEEYEYEPVATPSESELIPARTLAPVAHQPVQEEVQPELARIVTVHPSTYNEAREIGEAFRDGIPVIINLSGMSEAEAKRMVDFSAGLVFGRHGAIERVTSRVFLLSPASVHVQSEPREADPQGRFFNQG